MATHPAQRPDKRQQLLDTATRLFAEHGYQAVGVDRILAESGIAKATLYKFFPAKEDLVAEVLAQRRAGIDAALAEAVRRKRSARTQLRAVFDWYDDWMRGEEFHGCMFMHAAAEHGSHHQAVLRAVAEQKAELVEVIAGILERGGMAQSAAAGLASTMVILIDGAIIAREALGNRDAAAQAWSAAQALLPDNVR
ncbi:AcrR family transcriptional regulator [Endobacter medicaginis]|uniref:AcrR family transcriptional regulator n=1 Tax=Endobacter medicaginis TaxID=1181271 RepID=A0A839V3I5_9PROT|nr:TetR/AcrR family transcriptional regulator [Endobacter medicaginis]MBB3175415.1 AcrR family transcriptional regulator [Endobacter medicaginis]MCX5476880.1 TetR/AcrR family transcriptional regulator [Endobacter medicaginis]NVN29579.1 TetR/AcrR family transcriptional regulator [Endobacter medicaginis]